MKYSLHDVHHMAYHHPDIQLDNLVHLDLHFQESSTHVIHYTRHVSSSLQVQI